MKLIVLLTLLALTSFATCLPDNFNEAMNILTRNKRDADNQCTLGCLTNFANRLAKSDALKDYLKEENALAPCRWYKPDLVNVVCGIKAELLQCVESCHDQLKLLATKLIPFELFICDEKFKSFPQVYPCIEKTCSQVDQVCSVTCNSSRDNAKQILNMDKFHPGRPPIIAVDKSNKFLGDACNYIDCYNRCMKPLLKEKCDQATADLESDIISQTKTAILKLTSAFGGQIPDVCKNTVVSPYYR